MVNLKQIIDILNLDNHYGISKEIDIAKGINKLPNNFKDSKKIIKRRFKSLNNG